MGKFSHSDTTDIERIIQEYVPGKQVTLAHLLANPTVELCQKVGVEHAEAIGILTLTPGETAMIAGDIATKSAAVEIGFLDRFSGALVITGSIGAVDEAMDAVLTTLQTILGYRVCAATKT
ncbi:BMC domain-containing protein [Exilibacterium tricleocarpae]|uniref:BMC domain-containing protein n=1 Tax=Exilibacterium tricleocarpae TaxID=2591008 RepID=A0A545TV64_9GAMM|nr:BMC domain-containing protein [Exilibacterium tricleocarpae]TQV81115.1 BMC domain-containing protein [Exilibacterium tricleocarpae]